LLNSSVLESKTVFRLGKEEGNGNIGSRATLSIGQCGQLPRVIKDFSDFCHTIVKEI
jgi:hypothetical protein